MSHAQRIRYLVDGEPFFAAFRQAALRAERSIFILGWDIHSTFELSREDPADGMAGVGTDGSYSPQRIAGIAGPTLLKEGRHYGNALLSRPPCTGPGQMHDH